MDWTESKRQAAERRLNRWARLQRQTISTNEANYCGEPVDQEVLRALADDLNTPQVLTRLFEMETEVSVSKQVNSPAAIRFFNTLLFLGFKDLDTQRILRHRAVEDAFTGVAIQAILDARAAARQAKDFVLADAIRDGFKDAGVEVKDSEEGTKWILLSHFDRDRLAELLHRVNP